MRRRTVAVLAIALACLAGSLAHVSDAAAQTPPAPPLPPPGGPPQARNCSIPYPENRNPAFDPNGRLTATLDSATGVVTVEVASLPAGVTCYAIGREPSGTWPVKFGWSEDGITEAEPFVDLTARSSAQRYCYRLLFGSPLGHSGQSEPVCIDMPASIAPTPTATPTMGPTPKPPTSPGLPPPAPVTSVAPATGTPAPPPLGNGLPAEGPQPAVPIAVAAMLAALLGLGATAFARRR